ncbi:MAG: DUF4249 family protein [Candidatus Marinimicrobia bacterium]|nr:DUF4249 family protein [Candidatus Neomarinimicrobiota bacterium]
MIKRFLTISFSILFLSCGFDDDIAVYEDKLVIFSNLSAGFSMGTVGDTCYVSLSSSIEEEVELSALYISDAIVTITRLSTGDVYEVNPVPGREGRYLTPDSIIFQSGETYSLNAKWGEYDVTAETTIPGGMDFYSPENETYFCDGEEMTVPSVNTENFELQWLNYMSHPDTLFHLINPWDISHAVYKNGGCYTESFASFPLFMLDFAADNFAAIKVTTLALQAFERGLEPYNDLDNNGQFDDTIDTFMDFNRNDVRDSSFVNLIYDTSLVYKIWKGEYFRDDRGDPYRINPFFWQMSQPPLPMNWLFFNYYGLHIVMLEATDDAYYNYYSGDPAGQNIYILPESNIIGGYGLFSSTNAKAFLVNIIRE